MTDDSPITRTMEAKRYITEEAVYGIILVAGMTVVSGSSGASAWGAFWTVAITVVVFWAAHVYAGTVAHLGRRAGEDLQRGDYNIGPAFRGSLQRASGLLGAAVIPLVVLLLGVTRVVDDEDAVWFALWTEVLLLAVVGYIAFAHRHAPLWVRLLGAVMTATFGIAMIALKAFIH